MNGAQVRSRRGKDKGAEGKRGCCPGRSEHRDHPRAPCMPQCAALQLLPTSTPLQRPGTPTATNPACRTVPQRSQRSSSLITSPNTSLTSAIFLSFLQNGAREGTGELAGGVARNWELH